MTDINKMVFVFGSNEGGHHGAGAARYARHERGAINGIGYGHTWGSPLSAHNQQRHAFAIPTKDRFIKHPLNLHKIEDYVTGFLAYAKGRDDLEFQVTCIGCGLAGLKHEQIAPLFEIHPENCWFDEAWKPWLPEGTKFWGTF